MEIMNNKINKRNQAFLERILISNQIITYSYKNNLSKVEDYLVIINSNKVGDYLVIINNNKEVEACLETTINNNN